MTVTHHFLGRSNLGPQVFDDAPSALRFCPKCTLDPRVYLSTYAEVGARWGWSSRRAWNIERVRALLGREDVIVEVASLGTTPVGLIEIDIRADETGYLRYLGVLPAYVGHGYGRDLIRRAVHLAWSRRLATLTLKTSSTDHPNALNAYLRCGFVEIAPPAPAN